MNKIEFSQKPSKAQYAIVASFDMSGFSKFCLRPDAHGCLSKYLSHVFRAFDDAFKDGFRDFFKDTEKLIQAPRPDFMKYTGDGALAFWVHDAGDQFDNEICTSIVAALRQFQQGIPQRIAQWEREWRVLDLPRKARFGIAMGPVFPLLTPYGPLSVGDLVDYAGYPINLAVRLQDHCPEVGFLVHKALHPQFKNPDEFVELFARNLKGALEEPVFAFKQDFMRAFDAAPDEVGEKFRPLT